MGVKHTFVSGKADGADATLVRPTNWNADHVIDSEIVLPNVASPATPAADNVAVYGRKIAGRMMLGLKGPSGIMSEAQAFIARNKVAFWNPTGNSSAPPVNFGLNSMSAYGTATVRNVATTSLFTRMKRLGYVGAATAGSFAGIRQAAAQFTLGNATGLGGFLKITRFGCSDAAAVAGARQFVGMSATTGNMANVEPSTLLNSIGVGNGDTDTNLKIFYGGSAAQTPIDLGVNFPANTLGEDVYELVLQAPAMSDNVVFYQVTRLNTGHEATGTLTGVSGTVLPAPTTLLSMTQSWRCNNATALAVSLDIMGDYIETDY